LDWRHLTGSSRPTTRLLSHVVESQSGGMTRVRPSHLTNVKGDGSISTGIGYDLGCDQHLSWNAQSKGAQMGSPRLLYAPQSGSSLLGLAYTHCTICSRVAPSGAALPHSPPGDNADPLGHEKECFPRSVIQRTRRLVTGRVCACSPSQGFHASRAKRLASTYEPTSAQETYLIVPVTVTSNGSEPEPVE